MSPPAIGTRATHIADETQNRSNRTVSSLWSPAVRRKVEPVSIGAVNIAVNVCPQPSLRHTDMVCRASGLDPPALRLCSCDLDLARVRHRVDQGEPRTGRRRDRRRSNTGRPGPGSGRARGGVVGPEELRPPCVSSPGRSVHSMALTVPAGRMPTVCRRRWARTIRHRCCRRWPKPRAPVRATSSPGRETQRRHRADRPTSPGRDHRQAGSSSVVIGFGHENARSPGRSVCFSTGAPGNGCSATSYSPTALRLQYHRRCQA